MRTLPDWQRMRAEHCLKSLGILERCRDMEDRPSHQWVRDYYQRRVEAEFERARYQLWEDKITENLR